MLVTLVLQAALPIALLAWLALAPLESRAGRALQALATAATLLALHLAGLWLMPPWWTPWLYWAIFAAALAVALRRPARGFHPVRESLLAAGLAVLGALAGWIALQAWQGRTPPDARMVELAFPLAGEGYYVANGGSSIWVSSHIATLEPKTARQRDYRGQSHGVDIVALGPWGWQAEGLNPSAPERYRIFGEPVTAPCDGVVVAARDGLADMRVPEMDREHMAGNHVLLRCGEADVLLAHLKRGSVRPAPGQAVRQGDPLGQVGNSGNSAVPHLHVHAQTAGTSAAPFSGEPLPITLDGDYLVRGMRR